MDRVARSRRPEADVLVVGLSARALAEAALRSGLRPAALDFFGDRDLRTGAVTLALGRDLGVAWSASRAAREATALRARAVSYAADLENAPSAVRHLARGRELLGNPPDVLRAVRDPQRLFGTLRSAGIPTPLTVFSREEPPAGTRPWLRKPLAGGGGRDVILVRGPRPPGSRELLQELVVGPVLGLSFLADGSRSRPLAMSLQIEDRAAFGASGFAYCGSLSCVPAGVDETSIREQAVRAARVVTRAFGLRGWNGMDFVIRAGEVVPLEVNPRHVGSIELWDDDSTRLFAQHVRACRGDLPEGDANGWLPPLTGVRGKAILFAPSDVLAGDFAGWSPTFPTARDALRHHAPGWRRQPLADLPHQGERIARGHPVCTLYAWEADGTECLARLRDLACTVERDLLVADLDRRSRTARAGRAPLRGARAPVAHRPPARRPAATGVRRVEG